ncbi:MAG TPA: alpha-amylase family glycosyl hydrolase [Vicinamibacterales bacterium]|nr:alpha-amylase family glycosyl hydrolase [Vicinamibacterales bacterium]
MRPWPRHPVVYEINAWTWLRDLSRKYHREVDLADVPGEEWDDLAGHGFDAVWFMGVWERSPAGIAISMEKASQLDDFRRALPDFQPADNVGSPYCVRRYVVDPHLGGPDGLAAARRQLSRRGVRLILDFVPNHVAPDHPWVTEHPEYLIQGDADDLRRDPASFIAAAGRVFACGRDPFFPAWSDVVQVNAFHPGLRRAALETINAIAGQCDGIRCDMAMLMLNNVFERTWGARAGARPADDYWRSLIAATSIAWAGFTFIAEAYWDLEWELQQQGFAFCYDKKLYDRMEHGAAEPIRLHLLADQDYQRRMLRFIENHDEPRAASVFPPAKARAAAFAILTLPGARLLHEGQFEGRKVRLPVFLGRRPDEPIDADLQHFYRQVLAATARDVFRSGEWRLCHRRGWPDNETALNLLSWCWTNGDERYLVVINFSDAPAQGLVQLPWDGLRGRVWRLTDRVSDESYDRDGSEMREAGLYVDLSPWKCNLFQLNLAN